MKLLWYLLTLILGLWGILSLIRWVEVLFTGGGLNLIPLLIALICLVGARQCLVQARKA